MNATATTERGLLMNREMVLATINGRKAQTRRLDGLGMVNERPDQFSHAEVRDDGVTWDFWYGADSYVVKCPYAVDRIWVREDFTYWEDEETLEDFIEYTADKSRRSLGDWKHPHPIYDHCVGRFGKTTPSIHMPRWACRLTLEVTDVRVERLQDITPKDAIAEGVTGWAIEEADRRLYDETGARRTTPTGPNPLDGSQRGVPYLVNAFADLWESINGAGSWEANPWLWCVSFRKQEN